MSRASIEVWAALVGLWIAEDLKIVVIPSGVLCTGRAWIRKAGACVADSVYEWDDSIRNRSPSCSITSASPNRTHSKFRSS